MPTPTPPIEALETARFKTVKAAEPIEVTVHFNPASLQYTVSNTLKDEGSGAKKKQYVSQTTAKLTMDLERADYWISQGAKPSARVENLLKQVRGGAEA